jgi:hypothetical protein
VVGAGVAAVVARVEPGAARRFVGPGLVLLPVLLLADAAWGMGGRLTAVTYPDDYPAMRTAVGAGPPGEVLVLPLSSFRRPAWNGSHTVLDPVGRYQPRNYVSSDVLVVAGVPIPGEDPRVAEATAALSLATPAARAQALAAIGIGIVVTDRTAPGDAPDVAGRALTPAGADLAVLDVAGRARPRSVARSWYAALGAAWGAYVATAVLLPLLLALRARRRRRTAPRAVRGAG